MTRFRSITIVSLLVVATLVLTESAEAQVVKPKPRPLNVFMCSGTISDELGQPMLGALVQLSKKRMDTGAWQLKTTVTTAADGKYSVTYRADGPDDLLGTPDFKVRVSSGPAQPLPGLATIFSGASRSVAICASKNSTNGSVRSS